jgi:hypothetical protein
MLTVIVAFLDGLDGHGEAVREGSVLKVFYGRQLVLSEVNEGVSDVGRCWEQS